MQTVEYLEDGSYIVTELEVTPAVARTARSYTKKSTYYTASNTAVFAVSLTGNFNYTYNVSCTATSQKELDKLKFVEVVMVRTATINDAEQLNILNDEFNGESETSIDNIRNSLMNNKQEVVIVADEDDMLVGFVCVQLKKSFCYDEYMPEITEVYVKPAYRKRGLASEMITFAEAYCSKNYPLHQYELLTGQENLVAQTVYNKLGYVDDNELHLSKQVRK